MRRHVVWRCGVLLVAVVVLGSMAQTPWDLIRVTPVGERELPVAHVSALALDGQVLYVVGQNPDGMGWIGAYNTGLEPVAQSVWKGVPAAVVADGAGQVWVLDLEARAVVGFALDPQQGGFTRGTTVFLPMFPPTLCEGKPRYEKGAMAIGSLGTIWVAWSVGSREPPCGQVMLWAYDTTTGQSGIVDLWTPYARQLYFYGTGLAVDTSSQPDTVYFGTFLGKGSSDSGLQVWRMDTMSLSTVREFGFGSYGTQLQGPFFAAHGGKLCVVTWGAIPGGKGLDILVQVFDGASGNEEGGTSFGWQSMTHEIAYGVAADTRSASTEFYVVGTDMTNVLLLKVGAPGGLIWSKTILGKGFGKALAISDGYIYIVAESQDRAVIMKIEK